MSEVDKSQLIRYIEIEKEIQQLEGQNVLKNYEARKKHVDDLAETIKTVEATLKQLENQTKKEKNDVDTLIKDMFKDENAFKVQMTREQEEYLEARNKEEITRKNLSGLQQQQKDLEQKADEIKTPAEKLKGLYEERDELLSLIFNGEYGSDVENELEGKFDKLMDKKQRVGVANYKWNSARVLLQHAVNQMVTAVEKWKQVGTMSSQPQQQYNIATDARNNLCAAKQNVDSTQRYLTTIEFPYCKAPEMETLNKAINNIYTDMQSPQRHAHALQCYEVTMKRAAALLQWFDNVIKETIQKDLVAATTEARKIEQLLRAERIKLIRLKVEETGQSTKDLNDAGLKGMTDGFSHVDQSKVTDADLEDKVYITRPEGVDGDPHLDDAQVCGDDHGPPPPTPLPLNQLAPMPSETDLFGNIDDIKEQHKKHTEEYMKTQQLNKARMEQGLQAKLQARRHKKMS